MSLLSSSEAISGSLVIPTAGTGPAWSRVPRRVGRTLLQAAVEHSPLAENLLWRLPASSRGVALTFDDGPDPVQTPALLDTLAAFDAKATFFVVGEAALRQPALIERMVAEGHAVGNHTHTHAICRRTGTFALAEELAEADRALRGLGVPGKPAFRPPFGSIRAGQATRLARAGRRVVLWSVDSHDYRGISAGRIGALGDHLRARDIVLLHDRFPATLEGLPELLQRLADRGLTTATVGREAEND
jgi:peptidoglycan/xylan/chitin deacetylase (PgdA/CDA1 family)